MCMHVNKRVELARLAGNSAVEKLCILLSFLLHHRVVFLYFSSACSLHDCLCLKKSLPCFVSCFKKKRKRRLQLNELTAFV